MMELANEVKEFLNSDKKKYFARPFNRSKPEDTVMGIKLVYAKINSQNVANLNQWLLAKINVLFYTNVQKLLEKAIVEE